MSCHGPDEQHGGLRLDKRASALAGGEHGPAFVSGKSDESRLVRYVAGLDEELVMPPEGDRLVAAEIATLKNWIDHGARWPDDDAAHQHWAFQPPVRPPLPSVQRADWVRNPVDAFILARLEREGLRPSLEADRSTLVRRLYLDLLGLPPTPDEVQAFLLDNRADSYEQLADHLLASPHYGERWGRWWLDLARYADTDGYEKDLARPYAWRWRNWVIDAFNRDLPFDQFTVEQLAGDLLPNATTEQKVATGFHRNTLTNREGGVDQEEYRVKALVDRVNTTGSVWLGLTIGCCECHSHKYDPLEQREFYGLYAFFNSADEADIPAPLAEEVGAYAAAKQAFDAAHAPLVAAVEAYAKDQLPQRQAEWLAAAQPPAAAWTVLEPISLSSAAGAKLTKEPDRSIFVEGENPDVDTFTIVLRGELGGMTALRLEVLPDDRLPAKGPGRVEHGNFVLSELAAQLATPVDPANQAATTDDAPAAAAAPQVITLVPTAVDFAQQDYPIAAAADGNPQTGWAVAPRFGQRHVAIFETQESIDLAAGSTLTVTLSQQYGKRHTIGRLRVSATNAQRPVALDMMPDAIATILRKPAAQRSQSDAAELAAYFRTIDPELAKLEQAVADHAKQAPVYPATQAPTLAQRSAPRETHIHVRGDFLRPGPQVGPATPAVLCRLEARGAVADRLDLARWLVRPDHPLTGRVTVNRIWQQHFGAGLVRTDEDFGTRGEPPSHPELLDWLAREFVDSGWGLKRLQKLIVTSATYRQASHQRADLAKHDPRNERMAHQNRLRVDAEVVRDLHLAVSGLLNPVIGGPSVRPPLPSGVAELGYASSIKWTESQGADKYRRGMYIFFQRTVPYPMLTTFDAPDSNTTCTRRERSNTPLQALTLLNDPVFFECAQALGRRIAAAPASSREGRIRFAVRLCLTREPSAAELKRLAVLFADLLELCRSSPEDAAQLIGSGKVPGIADDELAAWTGLGRTLLNLDEFVTRE